MFLNENGQLIDQNSDLVNSKNVAELLDRFGLNWVVEKTPLVLPTGEETDFFGTVRKDTKQTFGAFKNSYEVFQNDELANIVMNVGDVIGIDASNGGMFKGGAKVYMQLELDSKKVGNDKVRRYATAINSFDGSTSLKWGTSGLTISCSNTFNHVMRGLQTSIRHTSNMRKAINESLGILEKVEVQEQSLFEIFSQMADTKATQSHVKRVIEMVTSVDVSKTRKEAEDIYSTRAINNSKDLTESIVKEMSYKEDSLWGLFSGVTHFTTHKSGANKNRVESKMLGSLLRTDNKVFSYLAEAM